jgi:hypothetical protein
MGAVLIISKISGRNPQSCISEIKEKYTISVPSAKLNTPRGSGSWLIEEPSVEPRRENVQEETVKEELEDNTNILTRLFKGESWKDYQYPGYGKILEKQLASELDEEQIDCSEGDRGYYEVRDKNGNILGYSSISLGGKFGRYAPRNYFAIKDVNTGALVGFIDLGVHGGKRHL